MAPVLRSASKAASTTNQHAAPIAAPQTALAASATPPQIESLPSRHTAKSTRSNAVENCPLFKLSGELRNLIYRYTLLETDEIAVTASLREPGLVQACSIIRCETRAILCAENLFRSSIVDWNTDLVEEFEKLLRTVQVPGFKRDYSAIVMWSRNWRNLESWAGRYRVLTVRRRPLSPGKGALDRSPNGKRLATFRQSCAHSQPRFRDLREAPEKPAYATRHKEQAVAR